MYRPDSNPSSFSSYLCLKLNHLALSMCLHDCRQSSFVCVPMCVRVCVCVGTDFF